MKMKLCIAVATLFCSAILNAQQVTEEEYVKLDSELWTDYEKKMDGYFHEMEDYPERKDSITALANELYEYADKENKRLAVQYASTPSGFQRIFMLRLKFDKDSIESILASVPAEMLESDYGRSIRMHLDNEQVEEGRRYYEFTGTDSDGNEFRLSSLEGRNILMLYGGLGCMGPQGREELKQLLADTSRDSLAVVIYQPANDIQGLVEVKEKYGIDCLMVSDFMGDHTPFKILYGAQGTPTSFLINPVGTVIMKTRAFHVERVRELLGLASPA